METFVQSRSCRKSFPPRSPLPDDFLLILILIYYLFLKWPTVQPSDHPTPESTIHMGSGEVPLVGAILGHQQMSRATQGLSPAPWCGLPTAVLPQDLDTELSGYCPHCVVLACFPWHPEGTPLQEGVQCVCFYMQAHGNMPDLWYTLKDCLGKFEIKWNIVKQKERKIK